MKLGRLSNFERARINIVMDDIERVLEGGYPNETARLSHPRVLCSGGFQRMRGAHRSWSLPRGSSSRMGTHSTVATGGAAVSC